MTLSAFGSLLSSVMLHGTILAAIWYGRANVEVTPSGREVVVPISMQLIEPEIPDAKAEEAEPEDGVPADREVERLPSPVETPPEISPQIPKPHNAEEESAAVLSTPVEPLLRVSPTYPRSARRRGIEGVVVVRLCISAEGKVLGAEISRSSGNDALDSAAKAAALGTKFKPGTSAGSPIAGEIDLTFDFRLK